MSTDLAARLEAAAPDELERLGLEAARVLLGWPAYSYPEVPYRVRKKLGGNPALSLNACKRLEAIVQPGMGRTVIVTPAGSGVRIEGSIDMTSDAATEPVARLAAMLRAKP